MPSRDNLPVEAILIEKSSAWSLCLTFYHPFRKPSLPFTSTLHICTRLRDSNWGGTEHPAQGQKGSTQHPKCLRHGLHLHLASFFIYFDPGCIASQGKQQPPTTAFSCAGSTERFKNPQGPPLLGASILIPEPTSNIPKLYFCPLLPTSALHGSHCAPSHTSHVPLSLWGLLLNHLLTFPQVHPFGCWASSLVVPVVPSPLQQPSGDVNTLGGIGHHCSWPWAARRSPYCGHTQLIQDLWKVVPTEWQHLWNREETLPGPTLVLLGPVWGWSFQALSVPQEAKVPLSRFLTFRDFELTPGRVSLMTDHLINEVQFCKFCFPFSWDPKLWSFSETVASSSTPATSEALC